MRQLLRSRPEPFDRVKEHTSDRTEKRYANRSQILERSSFPAVNLSPNQAAWEESERKKAHTTGFGMDRIEQSLGPYSTLGDASEVSGDHESLQTLDYYGEEYCCGEFQLSLRCLSKNSFVILFKNPFGRQ
jgi:hypothetical protein